MTRPNDDSVTHYLCEWNQEIKDLADDKGFTVHDLKGKDATKENTVSHLKKQAYDFIIFNGHGDPNKIAGHKKEVIIQGGDNHQLLKTKIVYSVACSSARELGPKCVDSETKSYIGYENDFSLVRDKNMTSRPLQDEYAKPCLRASNQIAVSLIKGRKVSEATEQARKCFHNEILRLQSSESLIGAGDIVMCLIWNLASLKAIGDLETTI